MRSRPVELSIKLGRPRRSSAPLPNRPSIENLLNDTMRPTGTADQVPQCLANTAEKRRRHKSIRRGHCMYDSDRGTDTAARIPLVIGHDGYGRMQDVQGPKFRQSPRLSYRHCPIGNACRYIIPFRVLRYLIVNWPTPLQRRPWPVAAFLVQVATKTHEALVTHWMPF